MPEPTNDEINRWLAQRLSIENLLGRQEDNPRHFDKRWQRFVDGLDVDSLKRLSLFLAKPRKGR